MRYSINTRQKSAKASLPAVLSLALAFYFFAQVPVEALNIPKELPKDHSLCRDHFVILFNKNRSLANGIAWKAEYHYKKILRHLGMGDFHPWEGDDKCIIIIFDSQDEYKATTGAPEWSGGFAVQGKDIIATFEGCTGLEDRILPHELAHLILKKYFGDSKIPLWLNEGMAQYEDEASDYKKFVMKAVRGNEFLRVKEIFEAEQLPNRGLGIPLFYAESASIIDYMRSQLLQTQFSQFLKEIRSGVAMDEALKKSYQWKFPKGVEDFELRWIEYIKTKY